MPRLVLDPMPHPLRYSLLSAASLFLSLIVSQAWADSPNVPKELLDARAQACSADPAGDRCEVLECELERLKAQELASQAERSDRNSPTARSHFGSAGEAFFQIWVKHGEARRKAGEALRCSRLDAALFNAGKYFTAARRPTEAILAWEALLEPANGFEKSDLAAGTLRALGKFYQSLADFDKAATAYERQAKLFPASTEASESLQDAIVLRLGLGQEAQALSAIELFHRNYGVRHPQTAARIRFALAAHQAERRQWAEAVRTLQAGLTSIDKDGPPDVVVSAHALLAKALLQSGKRQEAQLEYANVLGIWKDERPKLEQSQEVAQNPRRLGKALTAVGEALFFKAEQHRLATVEKTAFPPYAFSTLGNAGPARTQALVREREELARYAETKIKPWLEAKQRAIQGAEAEYQQITAFHPVPPPRWVVAAAARVAWLWGDLYAAIARPNAVRKLDRERREAYRNAVSTYASPIEARAKAAMDTCAALSVRYQIDDRFSRSCWAWLAWYDPAHYRASVELPPSLHLWPSGPIPMHSLAEPLPDK